MLKSISTHTKAITVPCTKIIDYIDEYVIKVAADRKQSNNFVLYKCELDKNEIPALVNNRVSFLFDTKAMSH